LLDEVFLQARTFQGSGEFSDDVSMLVAKFTG
jgi:hypothetical protein